MVARRDKEEQRPSHLISPFRTYLIYCDVYAGVGRSVDLCSSRQKPVINHSNVSNEEQYIILTGLTISFRVLDLDICSPGHRLVVLGGVDRGERRYMDRHMQRVRGYL